MAEYVDRQRLKEAIREDAINLLSCYNGDVLNLVLSEIDEIPAEDVRNVVHGCWRDVFQDGPCSWSGECSVCGVRNDIPPLPQAHFCPNCGADMRKR